VDEFLARYPGYAATSRLDELRATEYAHLDKNGEVYLDYTGAGVYAESQLRAHYERVRDRAYGNPHSENPASTASTALVESARRAVLRFLNASPDEYAVIFTPNASGACRLVGEAYRFGRGRDLVMTADNHNSVNGMAIRPARPAPSPRFRPGGRGGTAETARPVRISGPEQFHRRSAFP
jgi:selenocysteine lyase/cysteine desulfurase